ncbi:MAG: DUF1848 domain-containing protein [Planctomycetaceae bacterium]|jgi:hypothetical protein|nr:DUF1848 domain-containing protein [Planctomycetaceae bacterium]
MANSAQLKTPVQTPHGIYAGIAPAVISASRATDIPAFQIDWLFRRLHEGYCVWRNPFNRKEQYVGFQNLRAVVFWTKNAEPLLQRIDEWEQRKLAYYIHFTLNNYEAENFERRIPPLEQRIETFRRLSRVIGKERVIWRFDPVIFADGLGVPEIFERISFIGERLSGYTEKLIFSFVDITNYSKVYRRLGKIPSHPREPDLAEKFRLAGQLAGQTEHWKMQIAACCEDIDFRNFGIMPSRCIDPELLRRLAPDDPVLTAYLAGTAKDKGQRKNCGCIVSKDIGSYGTCGHGCVYCYAGG